MRKEKGPVGAHILRRLIIAAAGVAVLGLAGCGMKRELEREGMLSYLNRKYGREFDFVEDYAGQAGEDYIMILAVDREDPERRTLVRRREKDGRACYEDNYSAWLLKDELEEKIGETARQCFGECKVYYRVPQFVFPEEFGADMDADVFLRRPDSRAQFYVYPEQISGSREGWEKRLSDFGKSNSAMGYRIRGTLSLPKNRREYDRITEKNFDRADYEGYEPCGELVFSLDEDGSFRYLRWINGKGLEG